MGLARRPAPLSRKWSFLCLHRLGHLIPLCTCRRMQGTGWVWAAGTESATLSAGVQRKGTAFNPHYPEGGLTVQRLC